MSAYLFWAGVACLALGTILAALIMADWLMARYEAYLSRRYRRWLTRPGAVESARPPVDLLAVDPIDWPAAKDALLHETIRTARKDWAS